MSRLMVCTPAVRSWWGSRSDRRPLRVAVAGQVPDQVAGL